MAYVTLTPQCCILSRPDKQQQICLNLCEWKALGAIVKDVTDTFCGSFSEGSRQWDLPHGEERTSSMVTRVCVGRYQDGHYVNIRVHVGDTPTKQGVTLNQAQWLGVKSSLGYCAEGSLARTVYARMVTRMARSSLVDHCEGCVRNLPSQLDHDCLTRVITTRLLSSLPPVNLFDFVVDMATASREIGHKLERPTECYMLCSHFLRQTIEEELIGVSLDRGDEEQHPPAPNQGSMTGLSVQARPFQHPADAAAPQLAPVPSLPRPYK